MSRTPTTRHAIEYGESLVWAPPTGTFEFYLWAKQGADGAAMRWRRVGGYNVASDSPINVPIADGGIPITGPRIDMAWGVLLEAFDGFDPEILQVTAAGLNDRLISIDVYALPHPTSTNAASIAAQERRFLKSLLEMRLGIAGLEGAHIRIKDPSGTEVERMELAAIDRRVAEVRARIAWFEQAAGGNIMPRQEHW